MGKNIYVGNLPYDTTGDDLVQLFQSYGTVTSGQVIIDKFSGRSRGFGFVEMANDDEAQAAIDALNGTPFGSRPLTVNEARPREDRGGRGGGGYGGGGRSGYGGGGGGGYGSEGGY
jgi:RNA recognition motif-containing protein